MIEIEECTPSSDHAIDDPVAAASRSALLRRARWIATAVGVFLLPWIVLLSATLPTSYHAQNWALAWTGLDAAEALAALLTAVLLTRNDRRAALTAVAGAMLVLADAWFDVCTSASGLDHALAVVEAACVELPLAAGAIWLACALLSPAISADRPRRSR